jgi:hypothetical protein
MNREVENDVDVDKNAGSTNPSISIHLLMAIAATTQVNSPRDQQQRRTIGVPTAGTAHQQWMI